MANTYRIIIHTKPNPGNVNCPVSSALGMASERLGVKIDVATGKFIKAEELTPDQIETCRKEIDDVLNIKITIEPYGS